MKANNGELYKYPLCIRFIKTDAEVVFNVDAGIGATESKEANTSTDEADPDVDFTDSSSSTNEQNSSENEQSS